MRLIILLAITIFHQNICISQKMVFEYKPEFKPYPNEAGYGSARIDLNNSDKRIYVIHNGNKIDYLLLNRDFSIAEKLSPAQGYNGSIYVNYGREYIGSMFNEKTNIAYSYHRLLGNVNKRTKKAPEFYRVEIIDFGNKTLINKSVFESADDEDYVTGFTSGNKFYIITCFNQPKQLSVRIWDENGKAEKKDFSLSFLDAPLQKQTLLDFISPAEQYVNNIDYKDEMDYPVKVFMENEKTILFTISIAKRTPQVLRLNLETSKADIKEIPADNFCISDDRKDPSVNNIHFFNERLYVINACKKKSQLCIFNAATLALEKNYELSETSTINLSQPSTLKKGEKDAEYLIDKEDLIKKLNDGAPQISVHKDLQGNTIISFGMYSESTSGSGGKFIRSPSAPTTFVTGTYGGSNIPITRTFANPRQMTYQAGSVKIVKTLLRCTLVLSPSNELIKLTTPPPPLSQAREYVNKFKLEPSYSNKYMMSMKGKFLMEYMNSKTETLYLSEIPIKN